MGRLLAYQLADSAEVTVFDQQPEQGRRAAAWAAGGMLAPYSELEAFDDQLLPLSLASLALWQQMAKQPEFCDLVGFGGTVIVNHSGDGNLHQHLAAKWQRFGCGGAFEKVAKTSDHLPWPNHVEGDGLFVPAEGVVDNKAILERLAQLASRKGARFRYNHRITALDSEGFVCQSPDGSSHRAYTDDFSIIIDTRGIGAKVDIHQLRGVRGEAIVVEAQPQYNDRQDCGGSAHSGSWQNQPTVRLLHPRYPIYLIPRPNNRYIIGASTIESEDDGPISVRSLLELLSAAFSVHPALAEARVVETRAAVRAAFDDNLPRIAHCGKVIGVNGLYRHGFLLAPILAQQLRGYLSSSSMLASKAGLRGAEGSAARQLIKVSRCAEPITQGDEPQGTPKDHDCIYQWRRS